MPDIGPGAVAFEVVVDRPHFAGGKRWHNGVPTWAGPLNADPLPRGTVGLRGQKFICRGADTLAQAKGGGREMCIELEHG